jgi:hypothetical protein
MKKRTWQINYCNLSFLLSINRCCYQNRFCHNCWRSPILPIHFIPLFPVICTHLTLHFWPSIWSQSMFLFQKYA